MSKKGITKYRIQKNGIDVCKLVFTKANDLLGRFDIKIIFYDEKYNIKVHKLFSYKSDTLYIDNTENKQISYHYGREDKVKIHLRNIVEHKAPEEIVYNLVPPNDYSIFPIPLFKIEVPNDIKEPKKILDSNKKKHEGIIIELKDNNTAEVFMCNPNDNIIDALKKYEPAFILETLAPIEYFASNGGKVGYEKNLFFYDENGENIVEKEMMASDFNLMISSYNNKLIEKRKLKPIITFIENELYEDIILNTSFNPIVSFDGKEERIHGYLNGGKDCFDFKNDKILIKDTIGERIWKTLKGKEKDDFFDRCIKSRHELGKRYNDFNKYIEKEKKELEYKVNKYIYLIIKLSMFYIQKYKNRELNNSYDFKTLWFIKDPILKCEKMGILLGKYLGINNFRMFKSTISYEDKKEKKQNDDIIHLIDDIKDVDYLDYCYFEYDSIYNIHILSYYINNLLGDEKIPVICRGEDIFLENEKWNTIAKELKIKKYTCTQLEFRTINVDDEFNRLPELNDVYNIIISALDN